MGVAPGVATQRGGLGAAATATCDVSRVDGGTVKDRHGGSSTAAAARTSRRAMMAVGAGLRRLGGAWRGGPTRRRMYVSYVNYLANRHPLNINTTALPQLSTSPTHTAPAHRVLAFASSCPRQSALAGQIAPIVESLVLSAEDVQDIVQHVSAILSLVDLAVLFAFGWLLVPAVRAVHSFATSVANNDKNFESSYAFIVTDHLGQIARLALLVYACDVFVVAFEAVGYKAEIASKVFAKILYTSWLARRGPAVQAIPHREDIDEGAEEL